MVPAPNGQMPAIARNRVDLPAPDGPVTSTRSPAATVMSSAATSGVPCGSRTSRSSISTRSLPVARAIPRSPASSAPRPAPLDRDVEAVEPRDHRAPFRQLAIDVDEERQRALHAVERGRGLHQPAELDRAGEIGRADHDEGKYGRDLRVAGGQEGQLLGALHDQQEIADDATEAIEQPLALGGLASEQRDLLGILPHAHQVEAEVGLEPLLAEIERDQRPADRDA